MATIGPARHPARADVIGKPAPRKVAASCMRPNAKIQTTLASQSPIHRVSDMIESHGLVAMRRASSWRTAQSRALRSAAGASNLARAPPSGASPVRPSGRLGLFAARRER